MGGFGKWQVFTAVSVAAALILAGYWIYFRTPESYHTPCYWDFAEDQKNPGNCYSKCGVGFPPSGAQQHNRKRTLLQADNEFWCCREGYGLDISGVYFTKPVCIKP
jgi:hypothetical protein